MADQSKQKAFIRVKDKSTKHQYDIHRSRFDSERHELVKRVPDSHFARPPKTFVGRATQASVAVADEGGSPDLVGES